MLDPGFPRYKDFSRQALIDRIDELEGLIGAKPLRLYPFGLTQSEGRIVEMISRRPFSVRQLAEALYPDPDAGADPVGTVKVFVSKIRHKLAHSGIQIQTAHRAAYCMDDASRARWQAAMVALAASTNSGV